MSGGSDLSLTREQIAGLLAELGQDLDGRGIHAQMFVVGGAAMALAYNMRRTSSGVIVTPVPLPTVPLDGRVLHDGSMTTGPDDLTLHWEDPARPGVRCHRVPGFRSRTVACLPRRPERRHGCSPRPRGE
jgi:hypothetical protein